MRLDYDYLDKYGDLHMLIIHDGELVDCGELVAVDDSGLRWRFKYSDVDYAN